MRSILVLLLLLCAPALGQETPAAADVAPVLSAALTRARDSGALERVLGTRHFQDSKGGLVTVVGALDADAGELTWSTTFEAIGAMREETLRLDVRLGLDGRVRGSSFRLVRGRDVTQATGTADGERLRLSLNEARGEHEGASTAEAPWGADVVPFSLAVFALPLLLDQPLTFRAYHPVQMAPNPTPTRLVAEGETVTLSDLVGPQPAVVALEGGRIVRIDLGGLDALTAITADAAKALRGG